MMGVSLCACQGDVGDAGNVHKMTSDGQAIVTQKMMAQYIKKVEITEENWKDYIDIVEREEVTKNSFGEVVSTSVKREWGCAVGDCASFKDFAIELKWNSDKPNPYVQEGSNIFLEGSGASIYTGGVPTGYTDNFNPEKNVDYVQADYLFIRAKGYVLILDLPEELWSTNEEGIRGIYLSENEFCETFEVSAMLRYVYEEYK